MKVYRQVPEDAEYREYYDSYRITVDNLNDTDFLHPVQIECQTILLPKHHLRRLALSFLHL